MKHELTNLAASVNQRLLNLRDSRKEDFQIILNRFGLERFLYRISKSPLADRLILKGAFSFELWGKELYRPTRDVDLLTYLEPSREEVRRAFSMICEQEVEPDGLNFDPKTVSVDAIRGPDILGGLRVRLTAHMQRIRIPLQFDVAFGMRIKPKPRTATFPTILPFPAPRILIYPKELTIADKYHAICKLGMLNSRVKDYYDIYRLSRYFRFMGAALKKGINTIFKQEGYTVPSGTPDALSDEFARLPEKGILWKRFTAKIEQDSLDLTLFQVIESLREFILPPARAAAERKPFYFVWPAGGPWTKKGESNGSL